MINSYQAGFFEMHTGHEIVRLEQPGRILEEVREALEVAARQEFEPRREILGAHDLVWHGRVAHSFHLVRATAGLFNRIFGHNRVRVVLEIDGQSEQARHGSAALQPVRIQS